MKLRLLYFAGLLVLAAASCQASPTPGSATPTSAANASMPVSTQSEAYPATSVTTTQGYPPPPSPFPGAIRFQFDRPVRAGATTITGAGPAGVVISIENVTTMGEELGSGTIGSDNRFSISVPPIEANVRLGILIQDTGSSGKSIDDLYSTSFQGDGALMVPQVGFYEDTVSVVQ